jgi:FkbM family methyltransferase
MPNYRYNDNLTLKTKILNKLRKVFTIKPLGHFLAKLTSRKPPSAFISKFVPPEYLYHKEQEIIVVRQNIVFQLNLSHTVDHFIYYDFLDQAFDNLMSIIKEDYVIIDIGANIGRFTFHFAQIAKKGRVICFEPDSTNYAALQINANLNNFDNISFYQLGLGSSAERVPLFNVNENNPGMNRVLPNESNIAFPFEMIDIKRLDQIEELLDINKIDLIKIDVEGFEFEVLQGSERLIDQFKPFLFVEINSDNLDEHNSSVQELLKWILSKGYLIRDASSNQSLGEKLPKLQMDIICIPPAA